MMKYKIIIGCSVILGLIYIVNKLHSGVNVDKTVTLFRSWPIVFVISLLVISTQIGVSLALKAPIGFDAGGLISFATSKTLSKGAQLYLSRYPNNLFLFFFERAVYLLAGGPQVNLFLTILLIINIIVLDIAVLVNFVTMKVFNPSKIQYVIFWILSLFFLVLTPWTIIFYSDTLVILPNSILCYLLLTFFKKDNLKWQLVRGLEIGLCLWIAYHIKPTSVIIVIAAVIVLVLINHLSKTKLIVLCLSSLIMGVSFVGLQQGVSYFTHNQTTVKISPNDRFTSAHFMMMGLNGNGGYSSRDVNDSIAKPTVAERTTYNKGIIAKRLKAYGLKGYFKFLLKKSYYTTNDGTLGWGHEGNFITDNQPSHHIFLKSLFYPNGSRHIYYRVLCQIMWVLVLLGVFLSVFTSDSKSFLLQLSIAGLLIFLLLFEGGRSRYLIQFLPIILLLSNLGYGGLINQFKNKRVKKNDISQTR